MKKIISQILIGSLIVWMAACTKETDVSDIGPKAVVESYLIAGQAIEVKIAEESITGTIDSLTPIGDLSVFVINNGVTYPLSYTGNGIYRDASLMAFAGETYELQFEYNNQAITAATKVPDKPAGFMGSATVISAPTPPSSGSDPPEPITFTWNNPYNDYHLLVVRCIEPNPVEISTGAILVGSGTFRTAPTQASTQDIRSAQFKYYGLHEIILYRILPEYAALYEDNGSNSINLTAPPGNIANGLGIFTGVNFADKLYITVQ